MNTCRFIFAVALTCMLTPVFPQHTDTLLSDDEHDEQAYKFHASSFSVSSGVSGESLTNATLLGFEKLAPNSSLINDVHALPDYNNAHNYYYYNNMTNAVLFNLGFDFPDYGIKNSAQPRLILGLSYHKSKYKELYIRYEEVKPYDTLMSEITDNVIYLDSVTKHEYDMNYYSEQIRLDANFIYSSDPAKRFSFYAGAGINAGISINAYSSIYYEKTKYIKGSYENGSNYYSYRYFDPEERKREDYRNKMNFGGLAYIPLGLDFRIGNKKTFWREMHLFVEARPGVNLVYIPELNIYTYGVFQANFGVKYEW